MVRPSKMTPEITKRIGENIALGLTYALAAELAGVTYKTYNEWNQKGADREIREILSVCTIYQKMQC